MEENAKAGEQEIKRKKTVAVIAIVLAVCFILFAPFMSCSVGGSPSSDEDAYIEDDSDYESSDYDSDYSDSSYDDSDSDYSSDYNSDYSSSSDDEYEYLHDEDSGISGVMNDDGEGIFTGEDFAMRQNGDGTSIATDGKGNWIADSDGDGEVDSMSIDGGETWF